MSAAIHAAHGDNGTRPDLAGTRSHFAQPGQEKRRLRLNAEALSRSSEQMGRMVELQTITGFTKTR
jgi:hypothetical protein